ncbi:copper chaperone PCu(A)C [Agaribacterium haliotis]|uniref:copper chaperone PCu(A)C n=1 Tax=Agaribacterium haliotis TaxID=2013869 RepID=UPI000BB58629|nr:copper chaperone PCu(A)C [Agaribacterium haliotis]
MLLRLSFLLPVLFFCLSCGEAKSPQVSPGGAVIEIKHVQLREMAPGAKNGVAYLTMHNGGAELATLNYVHSPRAEAVEVHRHSHENGVMAMREVKHLRLAPGESLSFRPGGYHLMLLGVEPGLQRGENVELIFEFEQQPAIRLTAEVKHM